MMGKSYLLVILVVIVSRINGAEVTSSDRSSRIVNGALATNLQFPYAVSIQNASIINLTTRGHICGGALVSLRHVLTAASCFYSYVNNVYTLSNASNYRVFAGSSLLTDDLNVNRTRSLVAFTPHPEFTGPTNYINDIGVATLATEFPANIGITVLPLGITTPSDNTLCSVAGWGGDAITSVASIQQRYTVKYIYNQQQCTLLYATQANYPNINTSMLCAAQFDVVAPSCTGDTGNALVCNGNLTGVLSVHHNCSAITWPEIFTNTANYTTWIQGVVNSAGHVVPGFAVFSVLIILQMY